MSVLLSIKVEDSKCLSGKHFLCSNKGDYMHMWGDLYGNMDYSENICRWILIRWDIEF